MLIITGFGSVINTDRIVVIMPYGSAAVRRVMDAAAEEGLLCNVCAGRKARSVIAMDSGHVVVSSSEVKTLRNHWEKARSIGNEN